AETVLALPRGARPPIRARWPGILGRLPAAVRISEALGHPDAPAIIEREGDRLDEVRLRGEDVHFEARRQRGLARGPLRRQSGEWHQVGRRRLVRGADQRGAQDKRAPREAVIHSVGVAYQIDARLGTGK